MKTFFVRETFEQYRSWRSQAFIYVTVFLIAVSLAVELDRLGRVSDDALLVHIVVCTLALLLIVPAFKVALVSWRRTRQRDDIVHADHTVSARRAAVIERLKARRRALRREMLIEKSRKVPYKDSTSIMLDKIDAAGELDMRVSESLAKVIETADLSPEGRSKEFREGYRTGIITAKIAVFEAIATYVDEVEADGQEMLKREEHSTYRERA